MHQAFIGVSQGWWETPGIDSCVADFLGSSHPQLSAVLRELKCKATTEFTF